MKTATISKPVSNISAQAAACMNATSQAMRMTPEEVEQFLGSSVAQLIAELPFLAGCDDSARTSCCHLAVYVAAQRGAFRTIFDHTPVDDADVMARLRLIMSFKGGDPEMIDAGMCRLSLVMIYGYGRDLAKDASSGEYNPILAGKWNDEIAPALVQRSRFGLAPSIDWIMDEERVKIDWWGQSVFR